MAYGHEKPFLGSTRFGCDAAVADLTSTVYFNLVFKDGEEGTQKDQDDMEHWQTHVAAGNRLTTYYQVFLLPVLSRE